MCLYEIDPPSLIMGTEPPHVRGHILRATVLNPDFKRVREAGRLDEQVGET